MGNDLDGNMCILNIISNKKIEIKTMKSKQIKQKDRQTDRLTD